MASAGRGRAQTVRSAAERKMPESAFPLAFQLAPPDVHPERCVNARHRQAGCTLCVDHCPAEAIRLAEGPRPLPLLDEAACVGCSVCIPICPTDAFSQAMQPEARLAGFVDELPASHSFALACPQHPAPEHAAAPVDYVIRHDRCLAAFSPEQLLTLSGEGARAVWLEDGPCATCPIGRAQEDVRAHAHGANQLLAAFARPPAIHLTSEEAAAPAASPRPTLDGSAPAVDRRGFFRGLGKLAQQRLDEAEARAARPPMIAPGAPVDQRLPYHIPASHKKLDRHLLHLAETAAPQPGFILDADALPWSQLQLDEVACSGCQLCARFCPTGALNYLWGELDEGTAFNLNFHPRLCLDCNICVAVCPEDALDLPHAVSLADLLNPERQLLIADYLVPCERCGTLTRPRPDEERVLCYVCRGPTIYHQRAQRAYLAGLASQLPANQNNDDSSQLITDD
ncbi:MAG TPA: 4Fe-4S dicluster domain-containing protein [Caldilineales bacterium]|nr:4Fe-4S dicluster domain-containing protein [Caldilineales bacterium]